MIATKLIRQLSKAEEQHLIKVTIQSNYVTTIRFKDPNITIIQKENLAAYIRLVYDYNTYLSISKKSLSVYHRHRHSLT